MAAPEPPLARFPSVAYMANDWRGRTFRFQPFSDYGELYIFRHGIHFLGRKAPLWIERRTISRVIFARPESGRRSSWALGIVLALLVVMLVILLTQYGIEMTAMMLGYIGLSVIGWGVIIIVIATVMKAVSPNAGKAVIVEYLEPGGSVVKAAFVDAGGFSAFAGGTEHLRDAVCHVLGMDASQ